MLHLYNVTSKRMAHLVPESEWLPKITLEGGDRNGAARLVRTFQIQNVFDVDLFEFIALLNDHGCLQALGAMNRFLEGNTLEWSCSYASSQRQ